ncbi:hypothetical protein [Bilophila wadsworthia]
MVFPARWPFERRNTSKAISPKTEASFWMPFFMSDGATFSWFAFFMNGTHGEMTRFSGNAIPMRGGNAPVKWKGPGRLRRFFFSALISF